MGTVIITTGCNYYIYVKVILMFVLLPAMDSESTTLSSIDEAQPILSCGSYNFPPPHQLGTSLDIRSCRLSSLIGHSLPSSTSGATTLHQLSTSLGLTAPQTSELEIAVEEPDIGPPPTKKTAVALRVEKLQQQSIVHTHDNTPLKKLTLFLPPQVPCAIFQSRHALSRFVYSTATTFLSLWEVDRQLQVVDLRFPSPFAEKVCEDYELFTDLLSYACQILTKVKSVNELYLPQIAFHSTTQLDQIFRPLLTNMCTITHLFLSLHCLLQTSEIIHLNYKVLAAFFQKLKIREITVISTDRVVQEFRNRLQAELKKTASTIKVRYRSKELEAPGFAYTTDLDKETSRGEKVDPLSLVASLNMISEVTGATLSKQTRGLQERPQKPVRLPLVLLLASDNKS